MSQPIASAKHSDYFKLPAMFGITVAPWRQGVRRVWGKRHMIEFLIRLANEWSRADNMYDQIDSHGDFAPFS